MIKMNKEELALHYLQEYYQIPEHWEDYISVKNAIQENKQLKEVIDEVREKLKLERKVALSLKHPYTVSNIDEVLQILDKVK